MDIQAIVKELKRERDRLDKAIAALDETDSSPALHTSGPTAKSPALPPEKVDRLTPEGRKSLSDAMKKRWAEKRAKKAAKKGK